MGKKSRHKKQKSHSPKTENTPRIVQGIEPASLSGNPVSASDTASSPALVYNKNATVMDIQTEYVRSDITRILLLLVIVLLILTTLFLLNQKTTYLQESGQQITKILAG